MINSIFIKFILLFLPLFGSIQVVELGQNTSKISTELSDSLSALDFSELSNNHLDLFFKTSRKGESGPLELPIELISENEEEVNDSESLSKRLTFGAVSLCTCSAILFAENKRFFDSRRAQVHTLNNSKRYLQLQVFRI